MKVNKEKLKKIRLRIYLNKLRQRIFAENQRKDFTYSENKSIVDVDSV